MMRLYRWNALQTLVKMLYFPSLDWNALKLMGSSMKGYMPGFITCTSNSPVTLTTSGNSYYTSQYVPKQDTLSFVNFFLDTAGVFTAGTFNGCAVYSANLSTGLLTQVAISANNPAIYQGALGLKQVPLVTPFVATEGIYYAAATYQFSASTTNPVVSFTQTDNQSPKMDFKNNFILQGLGFSAGALPASLNISSLTPRFGAWFMFVS